MTRTDLAAFDKALWQDFASGLRDRCQRLGLGTTRDLEQRVANRSAGRSRTQIADAFAHDVKRKPTAGGVEGLLKACGAGAEEQRRWLIEHRHVERACADPDSAPWAATGDWRPLRHAKLPEPRDDFHGRSKDLSVVEEHLGRGLGPLVLHGLSGVGKTQLAAHGWSVARSSYDIVWWVDGREGSRLVGSMAALGMALGLSLDGAGDEELATATWRRLAATDRWLLVVELGTTPDTLSHLRTDLPHGDVLITVGSWQPRRGIAEHRVETLPPRGARAVLRASGDPEWRKLIKALGGFPLLLHQARTVLDSTTMTPAQYLDRLRRDAADVLDAGPAPDDHPTTIWAAWLQTLEHSKAQDAAATSMFEALSFCAPDTPLPADLIALPAPSGADRLRTVEEVDRSDAGWPWPEGVTEAGARLRHLRSFDLLSPTRAGHTIHTLISDAVRAELRRSGRAEKARATMVTRLAAAVPFESDAEAHHATWRSMLPHVTTACDQHEDTDAASAPERVYLLDRAATYFKGRGDLDEAGLLFNRAVRTAERHLPDDHWLRPFSRGNLLLNDFDVDMDVERSVAGFVSLVNTYQASVDGTTPLLTGSGAPVATSFVREQLADARQNLGYISVGHLTQSESVAHLRSALADYVELWPTDEEQAQHPSVARAWLTLSWACINVHDFPAGEAAATRGRYLVGRGPTAGGIEAATASNNLAMATMVRDPGASLQLLDEVVDLRMKILGRDHESVFAAKVNRGRALVRVASSLTRVDVDRAIQVNQRLLDQAPHDASRSSISGLHRNLGLGRRLAAEMTLGNSASSTMRDTGARTQALDLLAASRRDLNAALDDHRTRLADGHPLLIDDVNELVRVSLAEGHVSPADERLVNDALRMCSDVSPLRAETLDLRARIRDRSGNKPGAVEDRAEAKTIWSRFGARMGERP